MSKKTKAPKSWQEKLADSKDLPRVEKITEKMSKRWGQGTVVIPAPKDVDEIMKKVPKGKLITINEIRRILAKRHGAHRLSNNYWNFRLDCGLCSGRGSRGGKEKYYSLLADIKDRGNHKRKIPWWGRDSKETPREGRA